ncbi:MAG: ABC transporter permease, partial [Pseudomonadota bacterium]
MTTLAALAGDIRQALRFCRRAPSLTAIAVLSIAVGAGATAVVFTAVKAVLIEPLPYAQPRDLVVLRSDYAAARSHGDWVAWNDMQDVARRNRSFESLGTYHYAMFNLAGDSGAPPEALYGLRVSASLFPALGVKPMLGRNILPEEDQPHRNRVLILSDGLWARRFHSDSKAVGRAVNINGHDYTVIGVMPPGFDFPLRYGSTIRTPSLHMDFWAALGVDPAKADRADRGFGAVARLRKGVSQAQAQQDLDTINGDLQRQYPRSNESRLLGLVSLRDRTFGSARTGLWLLLGAAAMFMLIGCANVANLLLARGFARRGEFSVRFALGASHGRIVMQLMTESCVLALAGGLAGYLFTVLAWKPLPAISPMTIPRLASARPDGAVFLFTVAAALINGLLFGIVPAFRAAASGKLGLGESGARGSVEGARGGLRPALVAAEVALAVMLVIVGGLLGANFLRLLRTDVGFDANHVLASIIVPQGDRYAAPESRAILWRRILDSARRIPGVEFAGALNNLPFSGENSGALITADPAD